MVTPPDRPIVPLTSVIGQGAKRGRHEGWNSDSSVRSRRVLGLLIAFHGYCAALVSSLSVIGAVAGRNPVGNLKGAVITGVIAWGLIKVGRSLRRSAVEL